MKRLLLVVLFLTACDTGTPQGSCQYYHYNDYTTETEHCNSDTCTTDYEQHHDYVCDRYYPAPSDDHGDVPR